MTWTAEPHGDGIAIYSGRDGHHHGYRLFQVSDGDWQFDANLKFMLEAVNSYHSQRARIEELERELAEARNAALEEVERETLICSTLPHARRIIHAMKTEPK